MKQIAIQIAEKLLHIGAIKLQLDNPFVWASGWNSPIYTDVRMALSYPGIRSFIKVELSRLIMENYGQVDVVASVATGAIAQGALVADTLNLPFAYVRDTPKDHGLENLIEGNIKPGQKVVVVEDLLSTGSNCLKASQNIAMAGGDVLGMVVMFDYELTQAQEAFSQAKIPLLSICNYSAMINAAIEGNFVKDGDVEKLQQWHKDPANWVPTNKID